MARHVQVDNSYHYRRLRHADEIRLLRIVPGPFDSVDIQCDVLHRRRTSRNLKFHALSYAWGDSSYVKSIFVGSNLREHYVTETCFAALRWLRYEKEPRLVWIDAICINQKDDQEKIEQVRRMGETYKLAQEVIVFLGEVDNASRLIWEFVDTNIDEHGDLRIGHVPKDVANAINRILTRSWFTRVWELQEVLHGQETDVTNGPMVVCGNDKMAWTYFATLCLSAGSVYFPLVLTIGSGRHPYPLFETLCRTRTLEATDPRDKLLAILPLLIEEDVYAMRLISYSQSTEMVYTEIGLYLIRKYNLGFIQAVRHPHKRFPELASWVPDWSQKYDTYPLGFDDVKGEITEVMLASENFECCSKFRSDSNHLCHPVLTVMGLRVGRIVSLGEVMDFETCRDACLQFTKHPGIFNDEGERYVYMPPLLVNGKPL